MPGPQAGRMHSAQRNSIELPVPIWLDSDRRFPSLWQAGYYEAASVLSVKAEKIIRYMLISP